ncbi:MAG: hypothetical protein IJO10_00605 [Clostridia bacterium]|nr:hypothetical protein [Clostridia bacterium]
MPCIVTRPDTVGEDAAVVLPMVRRTAAPQAQPRRARRARPPRLRPQGANVRRTGKAAFFICRSCMLSARFSAYAVA